RIPPPRSLSPPLPPSAALRSPRSGPSACRLTGWHRLRRELHLVGLPAGGSHGHRPLVLDRPDDPRLVDPHRHGQRPQHLLPLPLRLAADPEVPLAREVGQGARLGARLEPPPPPPHLGPP